VTINIYSFFHAVFIDVAPTAEAHTRLSTVSQYGQIWLSQTWAVTCSQGINVFDGDGQSSFSLRISCERVRHWSY